MDERDEWRLQTDHRADGMLRFLDARFAEAAKGLEPYSADWHDVVAKRMIVNRCREIIVRPYRADDHLLRLFALETLQDLGRPWSGSRDGAASHPDYREEWRP